MSINLQVFVNGEVDGQELSDWIAEAFFESDKSMVSFAGPRPDRKHSLYILKGSHESCKMNAYVKMWDEPQQYYNLDCVKSDDVAVQFSYQRDRKTIGEFQTEICFEAQFSDVMLNGKSVYQMYALFLKKLNHDFIAPRGLSFAWQGPAGSKYHKGLENIRVLHEYPVNWL